MRVIGFSNHTVDLYKSYPSNQLFRENLENCYSDPSNITSGVPQGSILGPLLCLKYENHMPQAVKLSICWRLLPCLSGKEYLNLL